MNLVSVSLHISCFWKVLGHVQVHTTSLCVTPNKHLQCIIAICHELYSSIFYDAVICLQNQKSHKARTLCNKFERTLVLRKADSRCPFKKFYDVAVILHSCLQHGFTWVQFFHCFWIHTIMTTFLWLRCWIQRKHTIF